ncbi:ATP-binding cassette domain-containing protein [Pectobacterium sp. B2J-2]|uniref:ATP-binding cassette domain-containing protein n=1 Tax=Pectobacterium sp. B2J-2 TaxID=3385372 RepID=UPI0038FC249F
MARVDPFFTSLPLMGFLILVFSNMAKRFRRNALENNVEILRREGSLHDIYLDPVKSKEIWISGNGKKMSNIASQLWTKALNIEAKAIFQGVLTEMTSWLVFYLLFGCVLVKLAIDYDADNFHPGDLVLLISLVGQLQRQLNEGVEAMSQVADGGLATTHYHWLRRLAENKNEKIISLGKERNRGIEFKDVSFKYKNNNHDILKNINLHIPWGVSIGIVGVNGAGKTSLVKLLSGLQYPTVGDIYIDGNNLRDIDLDEWHSRCTCTFQDFVQLYSMLRESVGIGDLRRINDDEHIIKSINMTRLDTTSGDISHHLDTQLGETFNGVNLSYGQWQRVAIARGLMRDDAKIAILDEPTASLDPLTESKIFELFIKRTQKIKRNGGIVILVSHRFSATNLADIIFVLDNASIIEIGSHQELLSMNGKYASLFKLQSDAYMRM